MAVERMSKPSFLKWFAAGLFYAGIGVILGVFTALDLLIHYLTRKRRAGLGVRPLIGAVWSVLLAPTRRSFWAIGFWVALTVLAFLFFRVYFNFGAGLSAAALP